MQEIFGYITSIVFGNLLEKKSPVAQERIIARQQAHFIVFIFNRCNLLQYTIYMQSSGFLLK